MSILEVFHKRATQWIEKRNHKIKYDICETILYSAKWEIKEFNITIYDENCFDKIKKWIRYHYEWEIEKFKINMIFVFIIKLKSCTLAFASASELVSETVWETVLKTVSETVSTASVAEKRSIEQNIIEDFF